MPGGRAVIPAVEARPSGRVPGTRSDQTASPDGDALQFVLPAGASSAPVLPEQLDVGLDFESMAAAGSMFGSAGADRAPRRPLLPPGALRQVHPLPGRHRLGRAHPAADGAGGGRPGDAVRVQALCHGIGGRRRRWTARRLLGDPPAVGPARLPRGVCRARAGPELPAGRGRRGGVSGRRLSPGAGPARPPRCRSPGPVRPSRTPRRPGGGHRRRPPETRRPAPGS